MFAMVDPSSNEATLCGTAAEWRDFARRLRAGETSIFLDCTGDSQPYEALASRFVIEETNAALSSFSIGPDPTLRFHANSTGVEILAGNAEALGEVGDRRCHFHFDSLSFGDFLADGGADLVLEVIG
jgi:hypothetical protein